MKTGGGLIRANGTKTLLACAAAATLIGAVLMAVAAPSPVANAATPGSPGYWLVASDGGLYNFGTTNYGSERGKYLAAPIVGAAATPSGLGYWMVAADGGIFSFGDATFYGSMGGKWLNKPIVGMASTPTGRGYWLVASDGGIFSFGDATFYGSMGGKWLYKPIVGMASTPTGRGYWLVASDGGIFSFGDATFYGSMGGHPLNAPVVGMAADPDSGGYWMVASDGGIFSFNAAFWGSQGGKRLNKPITGMASISGGGYWLVASDGGVFTFGNAPFLGSSGSYPGPAPVIAITATPNGYPFPPGSTGYDISNYQCGNLPPQAAIQIVEVAGMINGPANPCYSQEASWGGPRLSSYIFMGGLPNPAPAESQPTACQGNVNCESYNFGYYWAVHWVDYSRSLGFSPRLWWLDVETSSKSNWTTTSSNASVIQGALAGLRATGVQPGIYATHLQWTTITGDTLQFPGLPLWVPGAGNISGGSISAQNICNGAAGSYYTAFGGGKIVLVQYGYTGNGYSGPASIYDLDYACP